MCSQEASVLLLRCVKLPIKESVCVIHNKGEVLIGGSVNDVLRVHKRELVECIISFLCTTVYINSYVYLPTVSFI